MCRFRFAPNWCGVLGVALLPWTSGCDYFRPAEPEPPPAGSVIVPDYSQPDSTLITLARAIEDKGTTNGGSVYAGAFAESTSTSTPAYRQFFWSSDVADWEGVSGRRAPPWTLSLELTFYSRFINLRGDRYRMTWSPDDLNPDEYRSDVAFLHRHYRVTSESDDGTTTSLLAVGYADLTLIRFTDGTWRIAIWQDRRDPDADPDAITLGRQRLNLGG